MAFGMGRLGWPPEQFWRATPREIGAALGGHRREQVLPVPERVALHELMAAYPDAATASRPTPRRRLRHER